MTQEYALWVQMFLEVIRHVPLTFVPARGPAARGGAGNGGTGRGPDRAGGMDLINQSADGCGHDVSGGI